MLAEFERTSFINCTKTAQFGLTVGDNPEQHIADVRKTDAWPPEEKREVWLCKPCPAKNIPLVGQRYLMKVWREAHHADRLTYEEWKQHASRYERAKDWLRHAFPRWWEKLLGDWAIDNKAKSVEVEMGNLPHRFDRTSTVQKQKVALKRNRYAIVAIPKKIGGEIKPDLGQDDKEEAWGLLFEEGFAVHRLLFYILVLSSTASLIAIVILYQKASAPTDPATPSPPQLLSNETWVFSWVGMYITLFLTVWFKWAETPKGTG